MKFDRGTTKLHARILRGKGAQKRNQTCSLSEAQQAQLLSTSASRHRCSIAEKSMDVSQNPQSNRVANETPWQQWRRQGCCTERHWNQRMQIFYVEYDDQAEARATSSSRLDNSHWISFFYPSGGTNLCFLTAWQSIHLGQPRITFPSPFRVAGVGRSIITRF